MALAIVNSGNEARGFVARKAAPDGTGPRAWLGPSKMEYETQDDSSDVQCPWDGCNYTSTEIGVKVHHGKKHGESIAGVEVECSWCGDTLRVKEHLTEKLDHHYCDEDCMGAWRAAEWTGEDSPAWDGGELETECYQCGKTITRKRVYVEGDACLFCSPECQHEWQSEELVGEDAGGWGGGPVTTDCEVCGEPTAVKQSIYEQRDHHMCSPECRHEWQIGRSVGENNPFWKGGKETTECFQCGGPVERWPSRIERQPNHFCSPECTSEWRSENYTGENHPNWEGGTFPYGAGWTKAKREKVRERQGRRCAGCGVRESDLPRKLSVHHIQKARTFEDDEARNDDSNLVAVCLSCHRAFEAMSPLRPQTPYLG